MAILQIIDQLDALVENSRRVPMSALRMIDYGQTKQAIERLRVNVPSSIMESERMLQERDRILEAAEAEATRIIEHAKRHANEILSNDSMVAAARQEAERIVIDAQQTAQVRRDEADRYAARVLEKIGMTQSENKTRPEIEYFGTLIHYAITRSEWTKYRQLPR